MLATRPACPQQECPSGQLRRTVFSKLIPKEIRTPQQISPADAQVFQEHRTLKHKSLRISILTYKSCKFFSRRWDKPNLKSCTCLLQYPGPLPYPWRPSDGTSKECSSAKASIIAMYRAERSAGPTSGSEGSRKMRPWKHRKSGVWWGGHVSWREVKLHIPAAETSRVNQHSPCNHSFLPL